MNTKEIQEMTELMCLIVEAYEGFCYERGLDRIHSHLQKFETCADLYTFIIGQSWTADRDDEDAWMLRVYAESARRLNELFPHTRRRIVPSPKLRGSFRVRREIFWEA